MIPVPGQIGWSGPVFKTMVTTKRFFFFFLKLLLNEFNIAMSLYKVYGRIMIHDYKIRWGIIIMKNFLLQWNT